MKERAERLKREIPAIFLSWKDKDTPLMAKIFAAITVIYALSPIDLIPDFVPVLGYLDDIVLLPLLVSLSVKLIPEDILEKNRAVAENLWEKGKPKKWYYAIPIAIVWALIIWIIIKMLWL